MIRWLTLVFIFFTVSGGPLLGDDAYHTYIRSQLAEQFDVTGGDWLLPDTEAQTNASMTFENVIVTTSPSSGIESFTRVMHVTVPEQRMNSWDNILRFYTTAPIQKGDQFLLIFWIDNTDDASSGHQVIFDFEYLNHPDERPLYLSHHIKPGWRQWFIPITAGHTCEAGMARFQIHLGHVQGSFRLAGVAMLNFKNQYDREHLPRSVHHLEYDGQDDQAEWRQIALERIDKIRKSTLNLKIVNQNNEPIEGASLTMTMQRHDFGFGSAISSDLFFENSHDARLYQQKLENLTGDGRSFNIVTLKNALKWPAWEDEAAWGTKDQVRDLVQWFAERQVRVRGHNLVWPSWDKMPDDLHLQAADKNYLTTRIKNHIFDMVAFPGLKGNISEWDVLNEIRNHNDLLDAMGSAHIYADCFGWAATADPQARLYLNENFIISNNGVNGHSLHTVKSYLRDWRAAGVPIHGLGMQGHMSEQLTPPEELLQIFNEFGEFDVELAITEYDAVAVDEQIAADYMRDILIAAFSHPNMRHFIMWGFWDGAHWKGDSPLFRRDWSLKPAGRVFLDYVFEKWWTTAHGFTDRDGHFQTRAFLGDYQIVVSLNDKVSREQIHFTGQEPHITIVMDTDQTTAHLPNSLLLEQNHPNPFNATTTLTYLLPADMPVEIQLFDNRGRRVLNLVNENQTAGRHNLTIDGALLPNGIYYVRLRSGQLQQVRKILLIK